MLSKRAEPRPKVQERTLDATQNPVIDIRPYDFSQMPLGYSWYIFGGSGKGKTILIENIMYQNRRRFHSGFVQTPTQDVIKKFAQHIPICYISPVHDAAQIDQVDDIKKQIIAKYPMGEHDDTRPMFMILDDVAYDREFCQNQIFNKITFNGRHQNFTMFLASQRYKALENNARSNVHFFATYWDSSITIRKAIWAEQFSSCFENYEDFEMIFKTVCCPPVIPGEQKARPRCLIIDKRYSSSDPNECCFYFEPSFDLPPFSVGSRDYLLIGWYASLPQTSRAEDVADQINAKVQQILDAFDGHGPDEGADMVKERVTRGRQSKTKKPGIKQINLQRSPHEVPRHQSKSKQ